jgi:hypothetical protein
MSSLGGSTQSVGGACKAPTTADTLQQKNLPAQLPRQRDDDVFLSQGIQIKSKISKNKRARNLQVPSGW